MINKKQFPRLIFRIIYTIFIILMSMSYKNLDELWLIMAMLVLSIEEITLYKDDE